MYQHCYLIAHTLQFVSSPKLATPRTAHASISALLQLKHTLRAISEIGMMLSSPHQGLLQVIKRNLIAPALGELAAYVDGIVTEDATWSKSPAAMRQAECFAVRPNCDGGLDAVRAIYIDAVQAVHALVDKLREEWALPALKLHETATRGYHLLLPANVEVRQPVMMMIAWSQV